MRHSEKIRLKILQAGVALWHEDPMKVTARSVAKAVDMTHATIIYHFRNGIRNAIAEYAVKTGDSRIIVQLIASNHYSIWALPPSTRRRHLNAQDF